MRVGPLNVRWFVCLLLLAWVAPPALLPAAEPLQLHPENPHYFLFRDKPTVLVTSGEHYGAVLNLDFDYEVYLRTLASHDLNLTRTFSGAYVEPAGAFNIQHNTLAPADGRFICPWARSDTPGYTRGGNKFDLTQWDPAYFERLKDFVRTAGEHGVVVEYVLFCPFYEDAQWQLSPMNAANNVQGIGAIERTKVYTLQDPHLTRVQDALVRKVVHELAEFDNLYYEICNEPYFGGVTLEWQAHVASVIAETERELGVRHLIAQNIANGAQKIENPNPLVSVFNFHYAQPPDAVALNYHLNKPIGDDETGFDGSEDAPYRIEGWDFLIAGGSVYSNLDYSFTVDREDGTAKNNAPGGGGPALRNQLSILKRFVEGFDFLRMQPVSDLVQKVVSQGNTRVRVLGEPGRAYAIYVHGDPLQELQLKIPAGSYQAEWVDTKTGEVIHSEHLQQGSAASLRPPAYELDIALRIRRVE